MLNRSKDFFHWVSKIRLFVLICLSLLTFSLKMQLKRVKLKKVTTFIICQIFDQKSDFFNFSPIGCIFWLSHVYLVGISLEIRIFWYQTRPFSVKKFGIILKGQWHKIFELYFFSLIELIWAPDKQAKMFFLKNKF